ncbi:WD40-repeat-containing domain protein [Irpex lacteus]|nr:WD40-repeat-containing domain protein [Irpex lacteus]
MKKLYYEKLHHINHGHTGLITSVAFSPDGMMLATCGLDGKFCVWGWRTGQLLFAFLSKGPVSILCCTWDLTRNDRAICGLGDGTIAEYSFGNVQGIAAVVGFRAHQHSVEKLALSQKYLASGAQEELRIWKQTTDKWMLESHLPQPKTSTTDIVTVTSLNWLINGRSEEELIVTYMYHGIVIYKSSDWTISRVFKHERPLCDARLSFDHKLFVVSKPGDGLEVYEVQSDFTRATHAFKSTSSTSAKYPLPVCFAHGGLAVLLGDYENGATLWDVTSGLLHQYLSISAHARTTCLDAFVKITEGSGSDDQFAIAIGYVLPDNTAGVVMHTIKSPGPLKKLPTPRITRISYIASVSSYSKCSQSC